MDERRGVRPARQKLCVTGTLGVLIQAARRGLVDIEAAFTDLQATDFRCTPELFKQAGTRSEKWTRTIMFRAASIGGRTETTARLVLGPIHCPIYMVSFKIVATVCLIQAVIGNTGGVFFENGSYLALASR